MIKDDEALADKYGTQGNHSLLRNDGLLLEDSTKAGITPTTSGLNLLHIPSKGNQGSLEIGGLDKNADGADLAYSSKNSSNNDNVWSLALLLEAQKRILLIALPTILA